MIGRHECKCAKDTDLKGAIAIGLDEVTTALEESFYDLTDAQAWAFPIPGRNNTAWIAMTTLQNLDWYANGLQVGGQTFEHQWRWDLWNCAPEERPKPTDTYPTLREMLTLLRGVREAALANLASQTEATLHGKVEGSNWPGTRADAYMRTIYHAHAHVRQIWLLRGALGLVDGVSWPRQHWA